MWPGYDFRAEGKEACRGQPGVGLKGTWGHFQWAIEKQARSDRVPSPCQCILSEPGLLLGGWVHLLFLFFHLLKPDTVVSRAEPGACAPVEQGAKWERRILNQSPQTRSHRCFVWPTTVLKMIMLSAKSCLTLCHPMDYSLPGSSGEGKSGASPVMQ